MNTTMRNVIPPYAELRNKSLSWFKLMLCILICLSMLMQGYGQCSCTGCECETEFPSEVHTTISGYWRIINANGVPNHLIGEFPSTMPDGKSCGRPNALTEQKYTFVMPAYSAEGILWNESKVYYYPTPPFIGKPESTFGVAVNGIPFDPAANEWWESTLKPRVPYETSWTINPLRFDLMQHDIDCNNGHVQPTGAYHYHGFPYGLHTKILEEQSASTDPMIIGRSEIALLGWAFDGNPIYGEYCGSKNTTKINAKSSYELKSSRSGAGAPLKTDYPMGDFLEDYIYKETKFTVNKAVQLDECNGHTGPTPDFPEGVYHYHILEKTDTSSDIGFPYIGRCWRLFTYRTSPNIFPK